MIHYSCRQCGRRLVSPEEDEGETFTCPKCGAAFRVPMADGANSPEEKMVPVIRDIAFGEKDFGQRSKRFGQMSIALSLLGPLVFALGVFLFLRRDSLFGAFLFLATGICEAASVAYGIQSRGTTAGKVGLCICLLTLVPLGFLFLFFLAVLAHPMGRWG